MKGDLDRAITDFDQAIALNPEYANAYSGRGTAYGKKGDFDRAITDFDQAIAINPEYAVGYEYRGFTYYMKGDLDRAITDFERALELGLDPTSKREVEVLLEELIQQK